MYEPTLEAVSSRDVGYIALFGTGAIIGLVTVVRVLAHLLREHPVPTLLVATGLILGSVRALWPWQDETVLLAPEPDAWAGPLVAALSGAATVILMWWVGRRARRLA
jgi:putative membrane protein